MSQGDLPWKRYLEVASILESAGIDAIEPSGATMYSGYYVPVRLGRLDTGNMEVYYLEAAKKL